MADVIDPQLRLALMAEHYQKPHHYGAIPAADVVMPGGNPGCGDVVVIYLKADGSSLEEVRFEGRGCTVSQAATSLLLDHVHQNSLSPEAVLEMDHQDVAELIGGDLVKLRPRCATLGLATLKGAIRAWRRGQAARAAGIQLPSGPAREEVDGLVLGEGAWDEAGSRPHE